ncbi:MAG TPA: DinB family protein [Flavobacteriales bacterium]|nr:DinB family protein [Flavobacteriales bacterium]
MQYIINELERNASVFSQMLEGVQKEVYAWKPVPERWSLLEIVCHLQDEEREDFRARLKHVLENPDLSLPPIDPPGWVTVRNYAGQDYETMVKKFIDERNESVKWLRSLTNPPLENQHMHSKFGAMSGNLFLSNWLAHDYLHMRQVLKLKFDYLKNSTGESLNYAGEW